MSKWPTKEEATRACAFSDAIEYVYNTSEGSEIVKEFHDRHGTESLLILTCYDEPSVRRVLKKIHHEIRGKRVVEIGSGVGCLAERMAEYAKHVFAIEADPAWTEVFVHHLYQRKPPNLTWIFGNAEEVADWLRGDVAIICTRSGLESMKVVALRMAPKVIAVYQDYD